MQTIRDLVEKTIEESIDYLVNKKGLKELEDDSFLLESTLRKVLDNPEIKKIKNKMLPVVKDSGSAKENTPSIVRPIILATHSITDIEICQIVSKLFYVEYNKLFIACRERTIIDARMQTANIMNKYLGYSLKKIGSIFGKDHSTVVHWLNNHRDLIETNNAYLLLYQKYLECLQEQMPQVMYSLSERVDISKNFKIIEEKTRISVRKFRKINQ
jgi:hypothetical protein